MKKLLFILAVFISSFTSAQEKTLQQYLGVPQEHDIFLLWDMDKWDASHGGKGSQGDDWHDMDFVCNPTSGYENYWWKLEIGNSSGSYSTEKLWLQEHKMIFPSWDSPNGSGPQYLMLPYHFEPTYYKIYFYPSANSGEDLNQRITNQTIDLYNQYLYDDYQYYESKINSFSASVDWQTGNINLFPNILQPDLFYLTVKVNNIVYTNINEELYSYSSTSGWERSKNITGLYIDNSWLIQNNLLGNLNIELILDSRMWNDMFYIIENSDNRTISVNNDPTPTTPSISMSGSWGDNPTLTFSGGGPNVDHYVLKKEYDFGSGYGSPHYVDPASNPYTDHNVEISKFGDLVARYSVKAVGPTGISSSYSNSVTTSGQSLWKESIEQNENEVIKEYTLESNYPNPFNPSTKIGYQIPKDSFVNLIVYNALGQKVAVLVNQQQTSGKYSVQFDASNLPSGVYIYKLQAGEFSSVKKMLLTK